jgi:F-type H+-transporting ATPase subunit delta
VSPQARPQEYAAAIYELALEPWTKQLGAVQSALRRDPALRAIVRDQSLPVREKLEHLARAVPRGLDTEVRKFVGTLLDNKQLDDLDAVLVEFERLVARRPQLTRARIVTAVPMTEEEKARLSARLVARFGADLDFQFEVDESVLGGVYVRVGDRVIDGTVAGKLAALRERLVA